MSKVPISVCIIAKNEEKYIEECLRRLQPYGMEIIVADTGSTDRTKEIALKYADKVVEFEWIDDFSAARNFCVSEASNDWILTLDCDEHVSKMNVQGILQLMQRYPKGTGIIQLHNLVYDEEGKLQYGTDQVVRFYHRGFFGYESPIHEQLVTKSSVVKGQTQTFLLPVEVIHHGYALTPEEMEKKQNRNLELLRKSVNKGGNDLYLYFQIGQSEFILKHNEEAIEAYEKALTFQPTMESAYEELLVASLAMAYVRDNRIKAALKLMEQYEDRCQSARYVYTHACILRDDGQILQALMRYVKASTLHDFDSLGVNKLYCYEAILEVYREFGEEDKATAFQAQYKKCKEELQGVINS